MWSFHLDPNRWSWLGTGWDESELCILFITELLAILIDGNP
jgi:hypothetical protein